jgi:glycosyltransferase involved in cell wall biosynthesis
MKILMISGMFYPKINGSVVAVSNMIRSLLGRGNKVCLVTRREKGSAALETWNGIKVIRVGEPGFSLVARISLAFEQFRGAFRECKAEPPDVIHAHGFTSLLAGATLGICIGRPVVVSFHGIQRLWSTQARWRSQTTLNFILPLERALTRSATTVLAQSNLLKGIIIRLYGVAPEKVVVVPNPIDIHRFEYGIPQSGSRPVVLFVGSLMRVHGPDTLVQALPSILERHPQARLLLVGKGPLKDSLSRKVTELGLGDSVDFLDEVSDTERLSEIYRSSRVVVIPLRYTGYILSLVGEEAMASGRPVVTTMTLDEELAEFGVLQTESGENSLGNAVSSVLAWDDSQYESVSRVARKYAEENFSLESVGGRLERTYKHAISEAARHGNRKSGYRKPGNGSAGRSSATPLSSGTKGIESL